MVGDLIREQNGDDLFEMVENSRLRAIRRREGNEKPGEELSALIGNLDPGIALQLIRGFTTYFQMVNTAEKVHRIRRRRDYLRDVAIYQPGGLEDSLIKLKASGMSVDDLQVLLDSMSIEPGEISSRLSRGFRKYCPSRNYPGSGFCRWWRFSSR